MKKLPKHIFVKIDGDKGDEFYNAADKAEHLVEMGDTVKIGRYELVELVDAVGVAQIVPPKAKRAKAKYGREK